MDFPPSIARGLIEALSGSGQRCPGWRFSGDVFEVDARQVKTVGDKADGQLKQHARSALDEDLDWVAVT
jgi:hypothetical protein